MGVVLINHAHFSKSNKGIIMLIVDENLTTPQPQEIKLSFETGGQKFEAKIKQGEQPSIKKVEKPTEQLLCG